MGVVDQAEERTVLRAGGDEPEGARVDGQGVGPGSGVEREGGAEGQALRFRQRVEVRKQRAQELVQSRARELRLGLHTGRAQDLEPRGLLVRPCEQCRLADPRLAPQHQRARLSGARRGEQGVDPAELVDTPDQHVTMVTIVSASVDFGGNQGSAATVGVGGSRRYHAALRPL